MSRLAWFPRCSVVGSSGRFTSFASPSLLKSCGCTVRPKRCEQAKHQADYAVEHAKLADAMAARLEKADRQLDALSDCHGLWIPDVDQVLLEQVTRELADDGLARHLTTDRTEERHGHWRR